MGQNITIMIDEVTELIRSGVKTSEIISKYKYPANIVKDVKARELELDKELSRKKTKADNEQHMRNKKEHHHREFLKRLGIFPAQIAEGLSGNKPTTATTSGNAQTTVIPASALMTNSEAT